MYTIFLKLDKRHIIKRAAPATLLPMKFHPLNQSHEKNETIFKFANTKKGKKRVVHSRFELNEYVIVVALVIAIWIFEIAPKSFSKQQQQQQSRQKSLFTPSVVQAIANKRV